MVLNPLQQFSGSSIKGFGDFDERYDGHVLSRLVAGIGRGFKAVLECEFQTAGETQSDAAFADACADNFECGNIAGCETGSSG